MKPITTIQEAVEVVLRVAQGEPRTVEEIVRLSGQPLKAVRSALASAVHRQRAHIAGSPRSGLYVWGPRQVQGQESGPAHWRDAPPYLGEKPGPVRPGSLDFLECGSLENGQRVERKRPILIAARPEQRA